MAGAMCKCVPGGDALWELGQAWGWGAAHVVICIDGYRLSVIRTVIDMALGDAFELLG